MPKISVKGAGRIRQVTNKTVWDRGEHYAGIWGVEGTLSAGIAALDLLDSAGREKAIEIAKGLAGEKIPEMAAPLPAKEVERIIKVVTEYCRDGAFQHRLPTTKDHEAFAGLKAIAEEVRGDESKKTRRAKTS